MTPLLHAKILLPVAELLSGRQVKKKLRRLLADSQDLATQRAKRRQDQLYSILTEAGNHVPYYKDLFREIGFNSELIKKDIRFLNEIPYLTKDIIREQGQRLIHSKYPQEALHIRHTGGSTGPTVPIYYDTKSLDWTAAENLFALNITGHKLGAPEVHLVSERYAQRSNKEQLLHWCRNLAMNRQEIHVRSLSSQDLASIYTQLKTLKPSLVQGTPSVAYALAKYVEQNVKYPIKVCNIFEATGETLSNTKFQAIQKYLKCQVYNRYGTAEFGVVAHSRSQYHQLQIIDYLVFPETYSLGNGIDEIVLTGLTNRAMPLVRFKTGDTGSLEFSNGHYWLSQLQGRVHDLIEIKSQPLPTSYFQDAFEQVGGVDEFQVVLNSNGQKSLKIIPQSQACHTRITNTCNKIFGSEFKLEFTNFDGLKRVGWRSKFNYVVREQ